MGYFFEVGNNFLKLCIFFANLKQMTNSVLYGPSIRDPGEFYMKIRDSLVYQKLILKDQRTHLKEEPQDFEALRLIHGVLDTRVAGGVVHDMHLKKG